MDKIEIIVYSLPIMFMLHDFEEIIGLKTWFDKNGEWLDEKFPMLTKHLQSLRTPICSSFCSGCMGGISNYQHSNFNGIDISMV